MTPHARRPLSGACESASLIGLIISALLPSTAAFAQGTAPRPVPLPTQPIPTVAVTVDVRDIVPDDIRDTPGAAATLSLDDLLTLRPFSVHDAFEVVAGVSTIDDDALGRRSGISLRGAPSRRSRKTLLLEDGVPINASTYLDPSAHYTPPLDRLERIDVLKGAGHVLHGPINNHGIVNFRNRQASSVPETTVDAGLGTRGTIRRHAMHRRTVGPVGLVLSYTGMHADGAFDVERHRYDDVFASGRWRITPGHDLSVATTVFRERSHYDESNLTPGEFAANPRRKRPGQQFNTIAVDLRKTDIVHEMQTAGGRSHVTRVFATSLDRPRFTVDLGESPSALLPDVVAERPFIAGETGRMVGRIRQYATLGGEHRVHLPTGRFWRATHSVQWGVRAERQRLDDRRTMGGPGQVLQVDERGQPVRDHAFRAAAATVFMQDAVTVGSWTVTPGIRAEHYTQHKTRRPSVDDGPFGRQRESDANTLVLPSVSVLYRGWRETALFANVARGYTPAFARTAATFPLLPEIGINMQAGWRTQRVRGVTLESAVFHNLIANTVVQMPFTIDEQHVIVNSEDSRSSGVDLSVRLDSAGWTGARHNIFTSVVHSLTHARFRGGLLDGRSVPDVPGHAGSITAGIEHAGGWHVSATASWVGRFMTDLANTRPFTLGGEDGEWLAPGMPFSLRETVVLGEVPARVLFSARAHMPVPGTRVVLWMHGRNLTDRLFVTDLANGLRPGAGRTLSAGARLRF